MWICFVFTDQGKPSLQGIGMTTFGPELCQNHYIKDQKGNTIRKYKDWWDQPSAKQILPGLRKQTFFLPYDKGKGGGSFLWYIFCDNQIIRLYKFCSKIRSPPIDPYLLLLLLCPRWGCLWRGGGEQETTWERDRSQEKVKTKDNLNNHQKKVKVTRQSSCQ